MNIVTYHTIQWNIYEHIHKCTYSRNRHSPAKAENRIRDRQLSKLINSINLFVAHNQNNDYIIVVRVYYVVNVYGVMRA